MRALGYAAAVPTNLRTATPADAAIVHRFISALAAYEREPDSVEVSIDTLRAQLAETPAPFECLIAENAGKPVGFVLFFNHYSTWRGKRGLWIEDLFVLPEHRGEGHGTALFDAVIALADERGAGRVEWSVLDWNQTAITFYEQRGAKGMTEWTTYRLTRA
jgi:GNAT superfamily N-acetyltransferase